MAGKPDKMKVAEVLDLLNDALRLQYRSALQYAAGSAALTGLSAQALSASFVEWSRLELDDCRRLVEKITALGGTATTEVAPLRRLSSPSEAIRSLAEDEAEAIGALHEVIPETGQEPRSEALEHLVEHLIMRKQQQLDVLLRVQRSG